MADEDERHHHPAVREDLRPPAARVDRMVDSLVEAAPLGMGVFDVDLRYVVVNDALAEINGLSAAAHEGRTPREVVPHLAEAVEPVLREVLETGRSAVEVEFRGETAARPGATRAWSATFCRLESGGEVLGVGIVVGEVTEQRRSERRLRQLMDGLFTFVGLCSPEGVLLEANRAALDAAGLEPADVLDRPFSDAYWWTHDDAVRRRLEEALHLASQGTPSRYDVDVRVKGGRLITIDFQLVPLVEDGQVTALVPSGMDISDRRRQVEQLEAISELTRRLSVASGTAATLEAVVELGPAALGAAGVQVRLDEADHPGDRRPSAAGPGAATTVQLRAADRHLGSIEVTWSEDLEPDAGDLARLRTVAEVCALTLERAQLSDARFEFLQSLQRQLLPPPPSRPRLDLGVLYEPATTELGFGGDWYDVVPLGEHRTAVVVGDVAGHGVEAAAQMSQVRGLVNGLIESGVDLDELLARVSLPLTRGGEAFVGTAAVVVVDTLLGRLSYVSAGHPPGVLRSGDGARLLVAGRGPVLGIRCGRVGVGVEPFDVGDAIVVCSDGLIERRGSGIDESLDRLVRCVADASPEPGPMVEHLRTAFVDPEHRSDDLVCVVARRTG